MLHEVYVINASGGAHRRVDTWDRQNRAIISRKYTQLGEVKSETAMGYLNELAMKYSPGTIMADVPSNRALGLAGLRLQGRMVLEVPIQRSAIPEAVVSHARLLEVDIRDAAGVVYNP